jgi:dipeptide/tripeptide permease
MPGVTGPTPPPAATAATSGVPAELPVGGHTPSFVERFLVLGGAVRELWLSLALKMLAFFAYTVMNQTLALWLTSDLGYSDTKAGLLVMGWSSIMTLFTVLVGSFTDAIGLRKTILFGTAICLFARIVMTAAVAPGVALPLGLVPLAIGEALIGPVLVAAIRRYTTTPQRSISFSMFYVMMNVGILLGNLVFDYVRDPKRLGENGHFILPLLHVSLSSYRTLFLTSAVLSIPGFLLVLLFLRDGVEATDEGVKITAASSRHSEYGFFIRAARSTADAARNTARIFSSLWGQPGFYRFLLFLSLAACLRLVIVHMYYTYPKFGIRELGPGARIGRLWAINPFIIILLVPLVGALTQKISAYRMVTFGGFIAASSVFIMALPPPWFSSVANGWFGDLIAHKWLEVTGPVNPYYVMIPIFVFCFSIGEAVYSPRLYEYAAVIAPKGQEASYTALSFLPFFLAKVLVGGFSGIMLQAFCPATGPRHSGTLWLITALTAAIAPIGLLTLRKYIRGHEAGREEGMAHP